MPAKVENFAFTTTIREDAAKLSDRVAIELGTRIVHGDIPPSTRLPTEADLCQVFGVSRSVIRDAVRTLSARGLVEVRQGHGMVTSRPSDLSFSEALIILLMRADVSVRDVREARAAIETELAPLAAERGTEDNWNLLRNFLEGYSAAVGAREWPAAQNSHLNFHYSLFAATQLPALQLLLKPMQQIILLSSIPPNDGTDDPSALWTEEDVQTHYPILDALRARDRDAVRAAMETHFSLASERSANDGSQTTLFRNSENAQALLRDFLTA